MLAIESITDEILDLKKDRNAVILAHHYQDSEIQDLADAVGDSLELSRMARELEGGVIAFCGSHEMSADIAQRHTFRQVIGQPLRCVDECFRGGGVEGVPDHGDIVGERDARIDIGAPARRGDAHQRFVLCAARPRIAVVSISFCVLKQQG